MSNQVYADIILISDAIFDGTSTDTYSGYVAIKGKHILACKQGSPSKYIGPETKQFDLHNRLICPGFADMHCFFNGFLLVNTGADLSRASSAEEAFSIVKCDPSSHTSGGTILAHGVQSTITSPSESEMNATFGSTPVVLFTDNDSCWMNTAARETYQFTPQTCWSEKYWRLLKYVLSDKEYSVPKFKEYVAMLNSRGVTTIKEMGFDDYFGFPDRLAQLEKDSELNMRVNFMSQPVGAGMNLAFGQAMREKLRGEFVRFSGFNQMTDGSIAQTEAEMKEPYCNENTCCRLKIDWKKLKDDTLAADTEGFRCALHAQGDAAIQKAIAIFAKCKRGTDGKVLNRHAITDLECSDPADLETMGKLGIIAEVYPQLILNYKRVEKLHIIESHIGKKRGNNYWNRRKMQDSGVMLSCATDLPLTIDNIPESVRGAVGGLFSDSNESFNKRNTISVGELLKAWTYGGQYNVGREKELGTLETEKLADITVLDRNLFEVNPEDAPQTKVCLTIVNGKIVYYNL